MSKEKILVTAALPYANGPLHVGHAIGAYIPADVYVRYNRLKGNDVLFIGGTDEYGTPIAVAAEKEGVSPQDIVDRYHAAIRQEFIDLGISFDNFSRTTSAIHRELSQQFFLDILHKGFIYKKVVERPYCPSCGRFLPDRYVRGVCPHCESKDERGDQCEACGKQLEPHELKEPYCVICKNPPVMKKTEHWFFKLSEFSPQLLEWVEGNRQWPDNARNFALGWIKEGLEDRAITRDLDWGVPVPVEGVKGKVLYVWFDAPIGYVSATKEWAVKAGREDAWKDYWQDDAKIVHFLGKDNIPFHTIIWPAMLMAHGGYTLPWQVSSNEYLTLEGKKMSTSRKWVLWLRDCLDSYDPDVIRYYLLSINPEKKDADFSLKEFQTHVNSELIAAFGNFVHRTLTFTEKRGIVPKYKSLDESDEKMIEQIREAPDRVGKHLEKFKFLDALKTLMSLAHAGNEYFQKKEPWKNEDDATLYVCANLCRTLAILSYPFLPYSSEKIWKMLALEGTVGEQTWEDAGKLAIHEGHKIGKVKALYKKIEDEDLTAFENKYLKMETKKDEPAKEPEQIDYEEFKKIDMRVGRIREVLDHPKADKLYILRIDLGALGTRQVVAGVKNSYKKEDLIGKEVIVVANLKPAELRGQRSEGMILAADVDGNAIILTTEKEAPIGSRIK